jgi:hypothetical protein
MNDPSRELIGRDRELSEADVALNAAASESPCLLLVSGDPGTDKALVVRDGAKAE